MAMTVTTKLTDLKTLFNSAKEVYFKKSEIKAADMGKAITFDMELPVLSEGISFNTGEVEKTEVKLTAGQIWTSKANKGDSDISFQVASVAGVVNDLFLENKGEIAGTANAIVEGKTYKGAAYSLAPKKVSGALVMFSEDKQTLMVLPNVEIYASLVVADGDNPAYFNVSATPLENSEGAEIMIMELETTPNGEPGT